MCFFLPSMIIHQNRPDYDAIPSPFMTNHTTMFRGVKLRCRPMISFFFFVKKISFLRPLFMISPVSYFLVFLQLFISFKFYISQTKLPQTISKSKESGLGKKNYILPLCKKYVTKIKDKSENEITYSTGIYHTRKRESDDIKKIPSSNLS